MSNRILYSLDVLAGSSGEINRIEARLKLPSKKLVRRAAEIVSQPESLVADDVDELVSFQRVQNLFHTHESTNKARRFRNSFTSWRELVDSHLFEVSGEYPNAMFLLDYSDPFGSGKKVIRAGEVVREIFDETQRAQTLDWALLDIFAPFIAEWDRGLEFGSLSKEWVEEVAAAVEDLRRTPEIRKANENATEDDMDRNVAPEFATTVGEGS